VDKIVSNRKLNKMSFRQFKNPYQKDLADIEEQNKGLSKDKKLAEFIKQNYVIEK